VQVICAVVAFKYAASKSLLVVRRVTLSPLRTWCSFRTGVCSPSSSSVRIFAERAIALGGIDAGVDASVAEL
jgi:hypothetical protein